MKLGVVSEIPFLEYLFAEIQQFSKLNYSIFTFKDNLCDHQLVSPFTNSMHEC